MFLGEIEYIYNVRVNLAISPIEKTVTRSYTNNLNSQSWKQTPGLFRQFSANLVNFIQGNPPGSIIYKAPLEKYFAKNSILFIPKFQTLTWDGWGDHIILCTLFSRVYELISK